MIKKEFITIPLTELKPYENNPRINDKAVKDVIQSMKDCGNLDPIEIDEENIILSGHTRLTALKELGYTETEAMRITGLTDEQKKKYRILANKTNELAEWDMDKLEIELEELDFSEYDFDLEFEVDEIEYEEQERKEANYNETISVIIDCSDEEEAKMIFEKLQNEGYECHISTL